MTCPREHCDVWTEVAAPESDSDGKVVGVAAAGFGVQSDVVEIDALAEIASMLHQRNQIDERIARIVQRPMTAGHLGEWIASRVFDIELEVSASAAAIDGRFRSGSLADKQ